MMDGCGGIIWTVFESYMGGVGHIWTGVGPIYGLEWGHIWAEVGAYMDGCEGIYGRLWEHIWENSSSLENSKK